MASAATSQSGAADARNTLTRILVRVDPLQAASAAHLLLDELGSFAAVLTASEARLSRLAGAAMAREIVVHRDVMLCALRSRFTRGPVLDHWQALLEYLRVDMGHLTIEKVRVLHLDTQNRLLRDELITEGTIDEAAVHVREVIRRALELGSAFLVLAHNHPGGCAKASRADLALTRAIVDAGRLFHITIIDHIIVTGDEYVSLKATGMM